MDEYLGEGGGWGVQLFFSIFHTCTTKSAELPRMGDIDKATA